MKVCLAWLLTISSKFISNKETNRPCAALYLARVEKGEVIPDYTAPKRLPPTICRKLLLGPQYELGDQTVKAGKNSQQKGFVNRFLSSRFQTGEKLQRNKTKIKRKSTTEILRSKTTKRKVNPKILLKRY